MRELGKLLCLLLLFFAPPAAHASTVTGRVKFVDEDNKPFWGAGGAHATIYYYALEGAAPRTRCNGESPVSDYSWNIADYSIPPPCAGKELIATFEMSHNPGWEQVPSDKPRIPAAFSGDVYAIDIVIRRPRRPPAAVRKRNFEQGVRNLDQAPETALFLLAEAAIGDDVQYTVAAADFLEQKGRQADVAKLFVGKDIEALSVDDRTKFLLFKRKGDANRAAHHDLYALEAYADAQRIFPLNDQVIRAAYTTLRQAVGAHGPQDLPARATTEPELSAAFAKVYFNWGNPAKPAQLLDSRNNLEVKALAFTVKNQASAERNN
jgi:hypothetical protein